MSNIKRYFEEGRPYFITTVTRSRKQIFTDQKLCRIFLITVEYYKIILDYRVHGYCVMPDHVHLLLTPAAQFSLSFIMKMIKGSFARKINKLKSEQGKVWQKSFYDSMIRNERQFMHQMNYIHQNPVSAGLVNSRKDYVFSSYHQYTNLPDKAGSLLQVESLDG